MPKSSKQIKIEIDTNTHISREVYEIIVETFLKYILYVCQQIPVQIDVLEREVTNRQENGLNRCDKPKSKDITGSVLCHDRKPVVQDVRAHLNQKVFQRRESLAKKKFERNQQRWFKKAENFMKNYKSLLTEIKQHIWEKDVKSTLFALGSSPLTPSLAFRIFIPSNSETSCGSSVSFVSDKETMVFNKRKLLLNLFRCVACNDDFSALSSETFSPSKLWTLFEVASKQDKTPAPAGSCHFVTRHEFKVASRARVFEVFLKEENAPLTEMILTPCVGVSGPICGTQGKTVKGNLFGINKYPEEELEEGMEPLINSIQTSFRVPSVRTPLNNSLQRCLNSASSDNCPFLEVSPCPVTPYSHTLDLDAMVETPVVTRQTWTPSPVKKLSLGINEFRLSPVPTENRVNLVWHQMETPIQGFKHVYL